MGLMKRFSDVMKAKTPRCSTRRGSAGDLDYSYEKQLEMVQKVRRGLADVATSRKRLELQQTQLKASADSWSSRPAKRSASARKTSPGGSQPAGRPADPARQPRTREDSSRPRKTS